MEEEPSGEAKEMVDSFVHLEDEGDGCCVVEGVEAPMVMNAEKAAEEEEEGVVDMESSLCLAGGIAEPALGMGFPSEDDARNFYNAYAKQTGFSIRVNSYYRSKKDNSIISREFCCSKEGFRRDKRGKKMDSCDENKKRRSRPITREGCRAMMTVRRRDDGTWHIAKFEKKHNHELVTPPMRHFLQSHKHGSDLNKCLSNSFSFDSDSFGKIAFPAHHSVNYIGKGRLSTFGIDAQSLLVFFKIMHASDPTFYYAIQIDDEDRLSSVFWVDTRSRITYSCFSDVVAFDTTYQVNQYKMPFAPFTGTNHHKQSVLFGCALLADETESTFVWLFTTWLEAMLGRQPGLIITDYDSAISRAVERVFPQSGHRYCKSHITSKMPKEMGEAYFSIQKAFQFEFNYSVTKTETPEEFESAWQVLLDKYNVRGNEWLQSLYIDRKLWVPTYVKDTFFAGTYNVRSESVNSLFDGYVNARTTLLDFAELYGKALDERYEKEARAEFETFYTKPVLKTPLPTEKQAAEVYTRKLFLIFQHEVFESLVLAVKLTETSKYEVARFDEEDKIYFVDFNVSEKVATCSCKMFEFEGILCRHVLAVFKATNVFVLPEHYILKRWTRNAKDEVAHCHEQRGDCNSHRGKNDSHYYILYQEAIKCAEEGIACDHSFKVALSALKEARAKVVAAKKNAIYGTKHDDIASASFQEDRTSVLTASPGHESATKNKVLRRK